MLGKMVNEILEKNHIVTTKIETNKMVKLRYKINMIYFVKIIKNG